MITYREHLVAAMQDMIKMQYILFENIVNLSLTGEMKHLQGFVDEDESYAFTMNHFRGVEDPNVQSLIQLCDIIQQKLTELMEKNNIEYKDIDLDT